ncbi:hypothetical protein Ccrd_004365, partial [Cynara cardunculus var. scolymus]
MGKRLMTMEAVFMEKSRHGGRIREGCHMINKMKGGTIRKLALIVLSIMRPSRKETSSLKMTRKETELHSCWRSISRLESRAHKIDDMAYD